MKGDKKLKKNPKHLNSTRQFHFNFLMFFVMASPIKNNHIFAHFFSCIYQLIVSHFL